MTCEDVLFHNPGPTNIPSSVLDAIRQPVMDYRGAAFPAILDDCLTGLAGVLGTRQSVAILPATGHGAWEAALVNLFSPGDRLLVLSVGYFGDSWADYARRFGLMTLMHDCNPRTGVDAANLERELRADGEGTIKGVLVTHCETSTGVMTDIAMVRRILDQTGHPALLLADVVSSLGCAEFEMDAWGVDVAAGAVQKGLMMPTGLSFTGISGKALEASQSARLPRAYWDWREMLVDGRQVNFPGTAPVQMFYGLKEALRLIAEEGLPAVLARHRRTGEAVRQAVRVWSAGDADIALHVDGADASPCLTTIAFRNDDVAERIRAVALSRFKVQIGGGIGVLKGKVVRIGHMGRLPGAHLIGALAGLQMAMTAEGVKYQPGGLDAAIDMLARGGTGASGQ